MPAESEGQKHEKKTGDSKQEYEPASIFVRGFLYFHDYYSYADSRSASAKSP